MITLWYGIRKKYPKERNGTKKQMEKDATKKRMQQDANTPPYAVIIVYPLMKSNIYLLGASSVEFTLALSEESLGRTTGPSTENSGRV